MTVPIANWDATLTYSLQWRLTPNGNDTYTLSVGGYPFTGVDSNGNVLATIDYEQNLQWQLTASDVPNAYT